MVLAVARDSLLLVFKLLDATNIVCPSQGKQMTFRRYTVRRLQIREKHSRPTEETNRETRATSFCEETCCVRSFCDENYSSIGNEVAFRDSQENCSTVTCKLPRRSRQLL